METSLHDTEVICTARDFHVNYLGQGKIIFRLAIDYHDGNDNGYGEVLDLERNAESGRDILIRATFSTCAKRSGQLKLSPCVIEMKVLEQAPNEIVAKSIAINALTTIIREWETRGNPIVTKDGDKNICHWARIEQEVSCASFMRFMRDRDADNYSVLLSPTHPHFAPHMYMFAGILAGQKLLEQTKLVEERGMFHEAKWKALENFYRRFFAFVGQEHKMNNGWLQDERVFFPKKHG